MKQGSGAFEVHRPISFRSSSFSAFHQKPAFNKKKSRFMHQDPLEEAEDN